MKIRLPEFDNNEKYESSVEMICELIKILQNLKDFTLYKSKYSLTLENALYYYGMLNSMKSYLIINLIL